MGEKGELEGKGKGSKKVGEKGKQEGGEMVKRKVIHKERRSRVGREIASRNARPLKNLT